jgi:tetratricopeptide (TPR) repeat protein
MPAEFALAAIGLGDVAYNSGDRIAALAHYQKAELVLEQALHGSARQEQFWPDLTRVWYKIGFTQGQLARLAEALESYRHELQVAQQWSQQAPSSLDVRRALALAEEHVGSILQQTSLSADALPHFQRSLDVYRDLLNMDPENAVRKLDVAIGLLSVANVMNQLGDLKSAEENYRHSLSLMENLVSQDPRNEQYQRSRNSILHAFTDLLYRRGKLAESRRLTIHEISALQPLIAKTPPSSHDLYQYCWDLLTTPFSDLHRPREVLDLSQKAADLTHRTDPGVLNALALAWEENGNLDQAIATAQQALALYPPSKTAGMGTKRAEIESNLARFQKRSTPQLQRQSQQ